MLEQFGDAWELAKDNILCLTTNGYINTKGECTMGRGIALQAKERFPALPLYLGQQISLYGNHVLWLDKWGKYLLVSFPVKHKWNQKADLKLIKRSVTELNTLICLDDSCAKSRKIFLPRPGCANGKLGWSQVKPIVEELPDNVIVITNEEL